MGEQLIQPATTILQKMPINTRTRQSSALFSHQVWGAVPEEINNIFEHKVFTFVQGMEQHLDFVDMKYFFS